MEKLQPIIKHRFWILLGVVVIMSVTGWWMATSSLLQAITTRKTALDGAYNKIPKGAVPNENWTKELDSLNKVQEKAINDARTLPWQKQQSKLLIWPEGVDAQRAGYWGRFTTISREAIRRTYPDEVRKVWKMVNPLDPSEKDALGVVAYPFSYMYEVIRLQPWKAANIVSDESIWEMKEDLWLLERLFQSITTVNGGLEVTQNDAAIHTIDRLELRGGGPKVAAVASAGFGLPGGMLAAASAAQAAAAAAASGAGAGGLMGRGNPEDDGPGSGRFSMGGGMAQANYQKTDADFDPTEEFGNDGSMGGGGAAVALGGPSLGGPSTMGPPRERYVNKEDNYPYKTRGFYLSVKMDHRKIPELIAELTANENTILPIEILRVQMTRLQEDEVDKVPDSRGPGLRPGGPLAGAPLGGGPGGSLAAAAASGRVGRGSLVVNDDDDPGSGARMGGRAGMGGGMRGSITATLPRDGANYDRLDAQRASEIAAAEATFKKVTSDPNLAQVAICGVFLLYKKIEEPAATGSVAPAAKPAAADSTSTPESTSPSADAAAETPASNEVGDAPASDTPAEPMKEGDSPNESATPGETASGTDEPAESPKESPEKMEDDENKPKSQN